MISYLDSRPKAPSRRALREQRALMRGQLLRTNGRYLCLPEFEARREALIKAYTEGVYLAKKPSENGESGEPEDWHGQEAGSALRMSRCVDGGSLLTASQ